MLNVLGILTNRKYTTKSLPERVESRTAGHLLGSSRSSKWQVTIAVMVALAEKG